MLSTGSLLVALAGCESRVNVDVANFDSAERITVKVNGVELQSDGGKLLRLEADEPQQLNLLDYRSSLLRLVSDAELASGNYHGLRLLLDSEDAEIELEDGSILPIVIDGEQHFSRTSFQIDSEEENSLSLLTVLDLRFSLADQQAVDGNFHLRQSARTVETAAAGILRGSVSEDYLQDGDCAGVVGVDGSYAIYLYEGERDTPTDFLVGAGDNPLASITVLPDGDEGSYRYSLTGLAPGRYTLALTCEADLEDPRARDALSFREPLVVEIGVGRETTQDLLQDLL
jgi:hypothetical protein